MRILFGSADPHDPGVRTVRQYVVRATAIGVVLIALVAGAWLAGLPHLQVTYRYVGPRQAGFIPAERVTDAWYFGPCGWQYATSGEYSPAGCPVLLWIPLGDCLRGDNERHPSF